MTILQAETRLRYTNGSVQVMSDESRSLYSPLSISRELLPWAVWVICLLTIIVDRADGMGRSIEPQTRGRSRYIARRRVERGGQRTADHNLFDTWRVMVGNFISGGGIMIMARATRDYLYGKIERQRERLREEGREQGLEEGREEGREALASEIEAWNRRRLEAERRGEPFDEPPPST